MSVIVITGGSCGIGASAATQCAKRGTGIVLTYKSNPIAARTVVQPVEANGGKAVALELGVGEAARRVRQSPASRTAFGRVGEPDDAGRVVATLLSEDGAWINAQVIEVAGGYIH